jgi:hypothetical protein
MLNRLCTRAFARAAAASLRRNSNGSAGYGAGFVVALMLAAPDLGYAAPEVFEETAKITTPDPTYTRFPLQVAVEGDTIIATARKYRNEDNLDYFAAFLFRRDSTGAWTYVRQLAETSCDMGEGAEDTCGASVSIRNGVAVVAASQVYVFQRTANGDWVAAAREELFSGPGDAAMGTGALATTEPTGCYRDSKVFARNSSGIWTQAVAFPGEGSGCETWAATGVDADMSAGNRYILGVGGSDSGEVLIYEPSGTTWTRTAALISPIDRFRFGDAVAMDDNRAFVSGPIYRPMHVFNRSGGAWTHATDIVSPDDAERAPPSAMKVRNVVVAGFVSDLHRGGSVGLFQQNSSGRYEQVARLVASDSAAQPLYLGEDVDAHVSGSFARVVATSATGLYVFDLDSWGKTPAPLQYNFEQGNAAGWTPTAGSNFSVATSAGSRVYRQSYVGGDASSFVTSLDWTDQAVEADVKPTAFSGSDRWVGLVVRRTDANNSYYLTLRQSNVLDLKRIRNGAFVTLASTAVPVVLNRNYRLRLEAVGTLLRAYVNGRLALQVRDTELARGHAGVRTYRASADFDNIVVSHNPHLTLIDHRTQFVVDQKWDLVVGTWNFSYEPNRASLVQEDTTREGHAVARVDARDQIMQVRATASSFAAGTGSRWFGLLARYVDERNYYYVTVRSDNTISLRKLVNGAIQVLDTAPLTVSAGTAYTLRLEAIGSSLRAYVNGTLVLEASDSSYASGRYGFATYRTAARYDDLIVWEP